MTFTAPVKDMRFTLKEIIGFDRLKDREGFSDLTDDLTDAVLNEAGRLAAEVIAPTNAVGDQKGSVLNGNDVVTPDGFKEAYEKYVEGGWNGLQFSTEFGGQGLPKTLGLALLELCTGANMAFTLCPLLTRGTIEALTAHGTQEQKELYLPRLISGEWSASMNLTEPQAGSDVGALTTKAEPLGDGSYKITGTKIFITWGEHDLAENIIHLVLARLPDAPPGTRGISLFIVPKFMVNPDGSLGERNDVKCVSLEHKLGIHASPTCVMSYGEESGAIGFLVGPENRGMSCMFTMMNDARLGVGVEGVGIAERAYQLALAYAQERRQGKAIGKQPEDGGMAPIIEHPDVRRMLLTMKSMVDAGRSICFATAMASDLSNSSSTDDERDFHKARVDLLTPIAKGWCSDMGVQAASIGVQVHGGMGFVEETGAAQHLRDARIAPIYEGTNGIQAIDLVTRKVPLNGGETVRAFINEMSETAQAAKSSNDASISTIGTELEAALGALAETTEWILETLPSSPQDVLAGATPYLKQFGNVSGGYFLAKGALAAHAQNQNGAENADYLNARVAVARFFAENSLCEAAALVGPVTRGAELLYDLTAEQLAS